MDDSATVTGTAFGTPTGNVTFTWFTTSSECSGASTGAGTIPLVAGVAHPSTAFGPLAAGSYSFRATYNGDANYSASTGPCENLTVQKGNTSTATDIHNATHDTVTTVRAGTPVHDQATVTGTAFGTPTGTVSFRWFTNGTCSGDSVSAGSASVNGAGIAHPSDVETPNAAATFAFQGTYSGDANYNTSTGPCEPLVVTKVDLEITKTASQPAVGAGQPFTYTIGVNNLGPSDATVDATVVDVLPADVAFQSFAALPAGVVCGVPVGRTITCTIPKGLLEVADPPVLITMNVVIPTTPTTVPVINKVIVTSPDDEAPCTVTSTNITCDPSNTNNYADVIVGFTGLTIVKDAQPNTGTPFQFTVSGGGQPANFSLVDDGTNTNNSKVLTNVVPGQTYTITEIQPTDGTYALSSISCTGGGTGSTVVANGQATVTLSAGAIVVCTFVNGAITPGGETTNTGNGTGTGSGGLAFTGSSVGRIFVLGVLLATLGLALLLFELRRRRREEQVAAARLRID